MNGIDYTPFVPIIPAKKLRTPPFAARRTKKRRSIVRCPCAFFVPFLPSLSILPLGGVGRDQRQQHHDALDGGQEVERDSNDIGADYENELIKGVTMHLKGVGEVSLDIEHDAEKAVESIQSFVDSYNELMTWMNTRMTEKQLDEDTAATVDSDDFRMRWGLLHGNSLLRQTKSQMRSLTSQNFTFSFTQRKSSEEVYGTMGFNGLTYGEMDRFWDVYAEAYFGSREKAQEVTQKLAPYARFMYLTSSMGHPIMPDSMRPSVADRIRKEFQGSALTGCVLHRKFQYWDSNLLSMHMIQCIQIVKVPGSRGANISADDGFIFFRQNCLQRVCHHRN